MGEDLASRRMEVDVTSRGAELSALERGQQWLLTLASLDALLWKNHRWDMSNHNAAVRSYGKASQWILALRFATHVELPAPDKDEVMLYRVAAISACADGLQFHQALALMDELIHYCCVT